MATNPTFDAVQVGDKFIGGNTATLRHNFFYISQVIDVQPVSTRFGKPDRVVKVRTVSSNGTVVDHSKLIWVSQLRQGLV